MSQLSSVLAQACKPSTQEVRQEDLSQLELHSENLFQEQNSQAWWNNPIILPLRG